MWRRDSYSLSRKLYSICHMVLKGVIPNDIGVFALRETIPKGSNTSAAVLVVRKRVKFVTKQSQKFVFKYDAL